jgi:hypothetical protein
MLLNDGSLCSVDVYTYINGCCNWLKFTRKVATIPTQKVLEKSVDWATYTHTYTHRFLQAGLRLAYPPNEGSIPLGHSALSKICSLCTKWLYFSLIDSFSYKDIWRAVSKLAKVYVSF